MISSCHVRDANGFWETAPEYQQPCPGLSANKFMQVTNLLLECPNLNSTHLFRADILHDSARLLQTVTEKERHHYHPDSRGGDGDAQVEEDVNVLDAPQLVGAVLKRKVLRRLIPRKPQLDRPLEQWCYIYDLTTQRTGDGRDTNTPKSTCLGHVVIYVPDVKTEADVPWYHPPVKSLAYLYQQQGNDTTLSVHFLPFVSSTDPRPTRLHRTFISLLQTFLRLAKHPGPSHEPKLSPNNDHDPRQLPQNTVGDGTAASSDQWPSLAPSAIKDTILPQHVVQDTYSRLKQKYAADLISRWVEKTEPSKHVFEDLSIAAFVIELWKQMYSQSDFPGFVDIACGNGVLTYILIKEGYHGRGFDARRRRTWEALGLDDHLDEIICVPRPFLDHAPADDMQTTRVHDGLFPPGTFIISNHADELTPWTPLLAALSCPASPLPFLAIPCCSHALSGAKHRYHAKDILTTSTPAPSSIDDKINDNEEQPTSGDLKALRAAKVKAASHADDKSMYACLTRKVVALARELGFDVELTLMRIPSTRNIGVVGNRKRAAAAALELHLEPGQPPQSHLSALAIDDDDAKHKILDLVARECAMSGGVHEAAKMWIERAGKLQVVGGRGKVNLGAKPEHAEHG
jgi:tRNASer (uridine44-2'-O)-methyltransferase